MSKYITCNKHYVKKDMKRSWGKGKELGERSSVLSCELWGMFFALSSRQLMLCSFAQGKPSIRPAQYIIYHIEKRLDIYNSIFFLWSPVSKTWLFSRQEKDFFWDSAISKVCLGDAVPGNSAHGWRKHQQTPTSQCLQRPWPSDTFQLFTSPRVCYRTKCTLVGNFKKKLLNFHLISNSVRLAESPEARWLIALEKTCLILIPDISAIQSICVGNSFTVQLVVLPPCLISAFSAGALCCNVALFLQCPALTLGKNRVEMEISQLSWYHKIESLLLKSPPTWWSCFLPMTVL